jgi:branched-chain amino acid transport system substrate-binding protein
MRFKSSKQAITKFQMTLIVAILLIAAILGVVAFYLTQTPSVQGKIVIGAIAPLTPPGSTVSGLEMKMAIELAVKDLNEKGGVLGKKIEVVVEDSSGVTEKGAAAAEKLITKDHVIAIFGEFHSSACAAEIDVAHRYHIPFVIVDAWANSLTEKGYKEVFRIGPSNKIFADNVIDFIKAMGAKRIAIIAEDTDFGRELSNLITESLPQDVENLGIITIDRTATDFTPQLLKFKVSPPPNLIINVVTGVACYLIAKQAYEIGLCPTSQTLMLHCGGDAAYWKEYWETTGVGGLYGIFQTTYHEKAIFSNKTVPFVNEFKQAYNRDPTYVALQTVDALWVLVDAIQRAGSTDSDAIIAALETTEYIGLRGKITFMTAERGSTYYHQFYTRFLFVQYQQVGQTAADAKIVFPEDLANGKLVYPAG